MYVCVVVHSYCLTARPRPCPCALRFKGNLLIPHPLSSYSVVVIVVDIFATAGCQETKSSFF